MFGMLKKSSKGFRMDPIVASVMIAIGLLAAGSVTLLVIPMINKTKDIQVMENLASIKAAVNLYMTNTNGEAPCFAPNIFEGSTSADVQSANDGLCYQNGNHYNYEQGVTGSSADLDRDGKTGERMTPFAILVPKYLDKMPNPTYSGEPYIYTKGVNDNNNTAPAFAVSAMLHSEDANETIKKNISILDLISNSTLNPVAFTDSTTTTSCRATDLKANGKFGGTRPTGVNGNGYNELGGWVYYGTPHLDATTFKDVVGTKNCDIYSDGNLFENAFGGGNNQSPSITINAVN